MEIVAADIGGTHARFALARIEPGGTVVMGDPHTFTTAGHAGIESAWGAFAQEIGRPLPRDASVAVAATVQEEVWLLTNGAWTIRPASLAAALGLDRLLLLNDFGAVAHAVAHVGEEWLSALAGPDAPLPSEGAISIVGPGTGLGVAQLLRRGGHAHVVETEGGHIGYAPLDAVEDGILRHLRERYGRVSIERVVSGPGLADIHAALGGAAGDDRALWAAAMAGDDPVAAEALERFCLSLGSAAGDIALAQGATGVVIAGGLGLRLAEYLPRSGFYDRFVAKGRFRDWMQAMPVKLITHPQPGLLGAAVAFAAEHGVQA